MRTQESTGASEQQKDPFLWLESIDSDESLAWVRQQNQRTQARLADEPAFDELYRRNLEMLDSDEKLPMPILCGDTVYNLWTDADNERGVLRRQPIASYLDHVEDWEVILSIDELAKKEGINWVVHRTTWLSPSYERCIIALSPGGGDARIQREFDLETLQFIEDGFNLPLAKSKVDWIDRDCIYVGTDFGEDSLTRSGFPRIVKRWKRGERLESAETILQGDKNSVGVWATLFERPEGDVHLFTQPTVAFRNIHYVLEEDSILELDIPVESVIRGVIKGQVIIELRTDWQVMGQIYEKGSIVSADINALKADKTRIHLLIGPEVKTGIFEIKITRDFVIVNRLEDMACVLYKYEFSAYGWNGYRLDTPSMGTINISNATSYSNGFFYTYTSFLQPTSLHYLAEDSTQLCVKTLPSYWDNAHFSVSRFEGISKDGTEIPYSLVHRNDIVLDGNNPTILFGYGLHGKPIVPRYSPEVGASWLEKGGVYAVANIRGGGEFGQNWHHAAVKENRQTTFDDFIAIANDLIERGVTSPDRLGITGRSAGGLLVGAAFTQRPDLFRAVYCGVPLLDMKRYHRLLVGATFISKYGNPDIDKEWDYISKYSPYHNLDPNTKYPEVFFHTSTRDDRIHPGHARKMKARMDDQGHSTLFYEATEGGHAGASTNRQRAYVLALTYSYFLSKLGHEV